MITQFFIAVQIESVIELYPGSNNWYHGHYYINHFI